MESKERNAGGRMSPGLWLLRIVQGALIGGGAILPGISGGVLCVSFGIYRPMMALLAHPRASIKKYWRLFLPVGIGWAVGFVGLAKLVELLFSASETLATALFVGLIAGTVPQLWRDAGRDGRTRAGWVSMAGCFIVLFGILLFVRRGFTVAITPNIGWFFFCGILWGLSLVVPGMTSSSILMCMGLYTPMAAGIADLDMGVVLPLLSGILLVAALTARIINNLFERRYDIASSAIVGIVVASTLIIVPISYSGAREALLAVLCFAAGFAIAWAMDRFGPKTEA